MDHSFVAEAIKRGQSEEEAQASRFRDALTRSVGIDEEIEIDTFGPFPVDNDTALFLCSDGLYKVMGDTRIRELFGRSKGPRRAAQALVATAYEDGSDDNISVVVAEFGELKRDRPGLASSFGSEPHGSAAEKASANGDDGDEALTRNDVRALPRPVAGTRVIAVATSFIVAITLIYFLVMR